MNMITRKKLIAALLIPIMLIAFSTPSFATATPTTGSIDISAIANKALSLALSLGTTSFGIAKEFAGQFLGINDIGDVLERSGTLISTGISAIPNLIGMFTGITSFADVLTKLLPKLLKFALETGITFVNVLLIDDYDLPAGAINLIKDLIPFAINAGKDVVGIVTGELNLGDLSGLLTGSTGDLSGILDSLFQGDISGVAGAVGDLSGIFDTLLETGTEQLPLDNLSGLLENFDTSTVVSILGTIMGGTAEDLLNSSTDIISGLINSFVSPSEDTQTPVTDFTATQNGENNNNTTNTNKPTINNQEPSNNANLGEYQYTFNGSTYKIAVKQSVLTTTLNNIRAQNLNQEYAYNNGFDPEKKKCDNIANYHIYMLLEKVSNPSIEDCMDREDDPGTARKQGTMANLKACIDNKKPARLHTIYRNAGGHWVTCVGYTNNGTQLTDFLFISSYYGTLITGSNNEADELFSVDATDAIRTYN